MYLIIKYALYIYSISKYSASLLSSVILEGREKRGMRGMS